MSYSTYYLTLQDDVILNTKYSNTDINMMSQTVYHPKMSYISVCILCLSCPTTSLSSHSTHPHPLHYSLSGNQIGDDGARALGEALQKCTQLKEL